MTSVALGILNGLWWQVPVDATASRMAGVTLGGIHRRFAWHIWYFATFIFTFCGRRGWHGLWVQRFLLAPQCFVWQVCHSPTLTFVLCAVALGGTYGTGRGMVPQRVPVDTFCYHTKYADNILSSYKNSRTPCLSLYMSRLPVEIKRPLM